MTKKSVKDIASEGGLARAQSLTKSERSEIARNAVQARWAKEGKLKNPILKASHGAPDRPVRIGDVEIPAYVLEDGTRVLTERGVTKSLGGKRGGSHWSRMRDAGEGGAKLPVYLSAENLKPFIDKELEVALNERIRFVVPVGGAVAYGVRAELLPAICNVFLKARDAIKLRGRQVELAAKADILIRGLAHVGIIALVDEATGYQDDRARNALAKILEAFVAKEIKDGSRHSRPSSIRKCSACVVCSMTVRAKDHNTSGI